MTPWYMLNNLAAALGAHSGPPCSGELTGYSPRVMSFMNSQPLTWQAGMHMLLARGFASRVNAPQEAQNEAHSNGLTFELAPCPGQSGAYDV